MSSFFSRKPSMETEHQIVVPMDSLNIELQVIIRDLGRKGYDIREFKQGFKNFSRGNNFEGKLNSNRQIVGAGRFYQASATGSSVYYGRMESGNYKGPGIVLRKTGPPNSNTSILKNNESTEIVYLQDWNATQKSGFMKVIKDSTEFIYQGTFTAYNNELQYKLGELRIITDQSIKLIYNGQFKANNFHGKGKLTIPDKNIYEGDFLNNKRNGLGVEQDLERKTKYIGEFEDDKRKGYGELIYLNRSNVRLKGFWTDGFVRAGDGIYCTEDGRVLEEVSDEFILI